MKKIPIDNNNQISLQFWDTAGQEKFRAMNKMHFRGAKGAILVYDITNRQSFESVKWWLQELL